MNNKIKTLKGEEKESTDFAYTKLPKNIEAEQALLGIFLNNNDELNKVADFLLPQHFFITLHQRIYEAILKLFNKTDTASPLSLKSFFEEEDPSFDCFKYLLKLMAEAQLTMRTESLANIIYSAYIRRELVSIGQNIIIDAVTEDIDLSTQDRMSKAEQMLFNLATQGVVESDLVALKKPLDDTIQKIALAKSMGTHTSGLNTGYNDMDLITGGLQNSDLIIVAGRPAMGKTAFIMNLAFNIAKTFQIHDVKTSYKIGNTGAQIARSVGVFSLEMSTEQIAARILSICSNINSNKILTANISADEMAKLSRESAHIETIPLFIDDSAALTISAIRTRARRMKRKHNIGLLVVDYLQLVRPSTTYLNNRVYEIAEISQGLKAIAKELDIPVIAASQLSRAPEAREDKRPQLSDLRESGNIEQDADLVLFLFREEYYMQKGMPSDEKKLLEWQTNMDKVKNIAEILVSKHRNGPTGSFLLHFNNETTGFSNLSMHEYSRDE